MREGEEREKRDSTHGDCSGSKGDEVLEEEAKPSFHCQLTFSESQEWRAEKWPILFGGADGLLSFLLTKPD